MAKSEEVFKEDFFERVVNVQWKKFGTFVAGHFDGEIIANIIKSKSGYKNWTSLGNHFGADGIIQGSAAGLVNNKPTLVMCGAFSGDDTIRATIVTTSDGESITQTWQHGGGGYTDASYAYAATWNNKRFYVGVNWSYQDEPGGTVFQKEEVWSSDSGYSWSIAESRTLAPDQPFNTLFLKHVPTRNAKLPDGSVSFDAPLPHKAKLRMKVQKEPPYYVGNFDISALGPNVEVTNFETGQSFTANTQLPLVAAVAGTGNLWCAVGGFSTDTLASSGISLSDDGGQTWQLVQESSDFIIATVACLPLADSAKDQG